MIIRKARKDEVEPLSKLIHQYDLFEHNLDSRVKVSPAKKYAKEISQHFKDKLVVYVVAEENGKIVGFASYSTYKWGKTKSAAIDDVFISEGYRRKGIGTKLFNYALTEIKKQKCKFIRSGVRVKNKVAQKFWQKKGFKINFNPTDYLMRKELR